MRCTMRWSLWAVVIALLGTGLFAFGGTSWAQDAKADKKQPSRAEQIATLKRQVEQLQKQLDLLMKDEENNKKLVSTDTPPEGSFPAAYTKQLNWRTIGPATMGGRVTDIAVYEAEPTTFWVATASGGLLKTVNNGITFEHQFDKETTVSLGAVAVAPSDPKIVWVGTGEKNPRNSVSYGDGIYKSTDGGKTWTHMGLKDSFQIGDIIIHPENPDVVYVGALGRLYGPNDERGLYKTTDGGKTWERILFVDDKTGVIDMVMNPEDPDTLIVATWERQRDEFDAFTGVTPPEGVETYGPVKTHANGTALYKTTDGGKTFKKLTKGLPTVKLGRIGLDYYRKDPKIIFAIIDSEDHGKGPPRSNAYMGISGEDDKQGAKLNRVTEGGPSEKAGLKANDIITAWDGKKVKDYDQMINDFLNSRKAGDKVKLTVLREGKKQEIELTLGKRPGSTSQGQPTLGIQLAPGGKIVIGGVVKGSGAEKAGLKKDDQILSLAGTEVNSIQELSKALAEKKPGDKVKVGFQRGDAKKTVEVELGSSNFSAGGIAPRTNPRRPFASTLGGQRQNVQKQQGKDGFQTGGIFKSTDGGDSWTRVNSANPRPMYFSVIKVDPNDPKRIFVLGVSQFMSTNGGERIVGARTRGVHADHHAMWIDPNNSKHRILGCDGGIYVTYDDGQHWDHLNHMALGQFYHVTVDNRQPYRVYGGLQDNGSWGGPAWTLRASGPINEDWIFVNGGDGFVCRVDPTDPDQVYAESQNGGLIRRHLKTGERRSIGIRAPRGEARYRFNWNTPFLLSNANPRILYAAGNFVFRSVNKGDEWKKISPQITRTDRGSATALAESPLNPDVLWVGTDDGAVWVTKDGGANWTNVTENFKLPKPFWVATIEASRAKPGRAYVCFDAHRSDDDDPYIFVTEDFGETWTSLRANLPRGSSRTLREDITNPNLLYLGTEFSCYASTNRGKWWTKLNNNLPTVAIHAFAQPTVANELVVATHGRSIWAVDVTALRQMTPETLKQDVVLFQPDAATQWQLEPGRESPYSSSARKFIGQNPSRSAFLEYVLKKPAKEVKLAIIDPTGKTIRELGARNEAGLHRIGWDLRKVIERSGDDEQQGQRGRGRGGLANADPDEVFDRFATGKDVIEKDKLEGQQRRFFDTMLERMELKGDKITRKQFKDNFSKLQRASRRRQRTQLVEPGTFGVVLTVDGKEYKTTLAVKPDPNRPITGIAIEELGGEEEQEDDWDY